MLQNLMLYIKNIAVFLIFMSLVGIITPDNKYKGYINLTLGFIMMIMLISPISGIVSGMSDADILLAEAKTAFDTGKYDGVLDEQIIETYKKGLSESLKSFVNKETTATGLTYDSSDFEIETSETGFGNIYGVHLTVSEGETSAKGENKPLIRIEKVDVDMSVPFENIFKEETEEKTNDADDEQIIYLKNRISDFYNISQDNIYIVTAD